MRVVAFVGILILVACSCSTTPLASVSPTPTHPASSSRTASPTPTVTPFPDETPSPSITPVVRLTAFGRSLSCSLPVTWYPTDGNVLKAGFITFPGSKVVEDRSAGARALFYDRAYRRWLPVWRNAISPDGKSYAYGEGDPIKQTGGKVHIVDVATGTDRVVYRGSVVYGVIDFAREGIYLTAARVEGRAHGLWLLDQAGGAPRLISKTIEATAVGGGAAWGLNFNSADPKPNPGGMEGPVNRLVRFDLLTGTSKPWFYRPGSNMNIMGFDATGNPMLLVWFQIGATGQQLIEVWLVKSPTLATKLFAASGDNAPSPYEFDAIDRHGVWLSGSNPTSNVWLYTGGSIRMVASLKGGDFHGAGGCFP